MTGTWKSNANQAGTFTMTLIGAASIHQTPLAYQHNVMPIAATLGTPGEVFHSMGHNVVNAVITVGVILFITFPANIFNQTFSSHYEEIIVMWKRSRRRLRRRLHLRDHADDEPDTAPIDILSPLGHC